MIKSSVKVCLVELKEKEISIRDGTQGSNHHTAYMSLSGGEWGLCTYIFLYVYSKNWVSNSIEIIIIMLYMALLLHVACYVSNPRAVLWFTFSIVLYVIG
jgi:hypothetical protein